MPKTSAPTKPLTSRDIARLANVSQTTVSRVLNEPEAVLPHTRELVLKTMRDHGYRRSAAARLMRTRRSNVVALVVANLAANPLYPALLQTLFTALQAQGYEASVWEAEHFDADTVKTLSESAVDGVIVATAVERATPFVRDLARSKPVVLVNRTIDLEAVDQVSSDNLSGGAAVARYFHQAGRSRIALVAAVSEASTIRHREQGFRDELARRGQPLSEQRVVRVDTFSYQSGFDAARSMPGVKLPTAVFCVNDIVGIGFVDGLRTRGVRVPDDIWVVGYDDVPMCAWRAIDLSTVRQPLEAMTEYAVARLIERIEGRGAAPTTLLMPNEIVVRGTSGPRSKLQRASNA
jgi:LacI family transcriptional regulator